MPFLILIDTCFHVSRKKIIYVNVIQKGTNTDKTKYYSSRVVCVTVAVGDVNAT